ncbi:hypothetical protein LJR099_001823 [Variovorax paradoxus]|uniref:hypothetical protein n=1 Tax=Variovorax paradoxus TaxID=34073 RepID=UPI00399AD1F3
MYLPRESMGRRLFCLAFVFFCLFGWKYSFVDFSLLIPGLIVLLFAKSAKFERHVLLVAFGVLILIFYQVVVQMAWLETDAESVLRLFRCFLFCLLVSLLAGSKCFTARELVNALFGALIVHAAIVVVSALFEPANEFFSGISGNDRFRPFRASGLLAGFDLAGFFCLAGAAMLVFEIYKPKSWLRLWIYLAVFGTGAFFTSRLTVAWFFGLALLFGVMTYKSTRSAILRIVYVGLFSLAIAYVAWDYFLPILDVTYSLDWVNVSDEAAAEITARHAQQQDGNLFWEDMFYLPSDGVSLVFGRGQDVLDSDVGYIKDIFRYGLIGVLYSLIFYAFILRVGLLRARKYFPPGYEGYLWLVFSFIALMSLKNNYFYTRGVFSLLMIYFGIFFMIDRQALRDLSAGDEV